MKEKSDVKLRLQSIRQRMKEEQIDAWIVLTSDDHGSEYIGSYFKCREYLSGFTGSAGSIVVLQKEAGLWTDGRYFLQAEKELEGSGIALHRIGEENVPKIEEYLIQKLPMQATVGVDGSTIQVNAYRRLKKELDKKKIRIRLDCDLVGDIWQNRPVMSCKSAWELDLCYAGSSRVEKFAEFRKKLKEEGADYSVISSLDDIAWILNIRGNDIACNPLVLGFLVIGKSEVFWFVQKDAVACSLEDKLQKEGIILRDYFEIYSFLAEELNMCSIYLDPERTNMLIYKNAKNEKKQRTILEGKNLTLLPKAIKNQTEIDNMRKAHRKDAVACIKFLYWLKTNIAKKNTSDEMPQLNEKNMFESKVLSELSLAEKLEKFRSEQEHYISPSFDTIVGYAEHGAVIHYKATAESNFTVQAENFVLIDSGGHYLEGTTDITRTIALGELTPEQKHHYTLVLKGNMNLAAAKFRYGCAGIHLDSLARKALWAEELDYNHGTGHGVGYLLNVHEPPNSFRCMMSESRDECTRLEPGMITSDEPGIYLPGKYGIRLENLILCKELEKNEFGRFMGFETLTLVPFDRDAILVEELEDWEREWLNQYHAKIREEIGGLLTPSEAAWLKEATAAL